MRKIGPLITGGAMLASLASPARAQASASATATASATIIQAITISNTAGLGFGTVVKPSSGTSTITVSATGNSRTIVGTAVGVNTTGVSSAGFMVKGEGGQHFSISVPASLSMTSGTHTLVVTTSNPSGTTGLLSGALGAQGSLTLGIGGSFQMTSATTSGAYTGNLVVTVAYN